MIIPIIISGLITILIAFFCFLFLFSHKIKLLERKIEKLFEKRTAIVPSIFETTKPFVNRHSDIFKSILQYRKIEFSQIDYDHNFLKLLHTETLIHNELNFIFKICNKHPKLLKQAKFLYVRELIINKSYDIGMYVKIYKNIIEKYNKLISIKNLTIVGLIIPLTKKKLMY